MKLIPTTGPDVFRFNIWVQLLNKQAFRFYGNEIFDHGYCEPIGKGIHVYTVQLATLFESKTVELISDQGLRKYCAGYKQAAFYRAGYDAGRAWFQKNYDYDSPARHVFGDAGPDFVRRIHHLAFHKKTLFDQAGSPGRGVYGVKLLNLPINARSIRRAGYYAAITAGIIQLVTKYTAVFHQHETCKRLTEGWTAADARDAKRFKDTPEIPYCEQRTYVIEKQPKIPIDMQDLIHITTRAYDTQTVTRENLPDYLTTLGFQEVFDFAPEPTRVYLNNKPGLTSLFVHITEDGLKLRHGSPNVEHTYWEGEDPTELLNQIMINASNLKPQN